MSSCPRPVGGIDDCFVQPLVTGDLRSTERSSPRVTVDHGGKKPAWDLLPHLYLRKFCFVVLATQPRAVHFKPISHVDWRIADPPFPPTPPSPVPHRIKWGGWKSTGDSALTLCNYMRSPAAHVSIAAEETMKNSHIHKYTVLLLTCVDR